MNNAMIIFLLSQSFNQGYAEEHLNRILTYPLTIPITSNTSSWDGGAVRLSKYASGRAVMSTGWTNVVSGAEIIEDDIVMICFYDGGNGFGSFVTKLRD